MNHSLLIFLGSGTGGLLRFWVGKSINSAFKHPFPYGTMVVNISGCLLIGFLFVITTERLSTDAAPLRALLLIGLLGGYTTYSSFSLESILLFENGRLLSGLLNILGTTMLCLTATWFGILGARNL